MESAKRSPSLVQRLLERLGLRTPPRPVRLVTPPSVSAIAVPLVPPTDDAVRRDGGKPTDGKQVPEIEMEKIKKNAVLHGKDEPGS